MKLIIRFLTSTVGRKYLMALTGLGLFLFLIAHLAGNLTLLWPGSWLFNSYAAHLESLKPLVILAEIGLLVLVGLHIVIGLAIWLGAKQARPVGYYASEKTKGGESHMNLSSTNMLILGVVIMVFVVVHVAQFKYGPGRDQGYRYSLAKRARIEQAAAKNPEQAGQAAAQAAKEESKAAEEDVRDLYRLVVETFSRPWMLVFYVGSMLFIGYHLRHGVWSMFQSFGAMPGKYSKSIYFGGAVVGALIALGFLLLPVWIFVASNAGWIARK